MVFIKSDVKHKLGVRDTYVQGETGDLAIVKMALSSCMIATIGIASAFHSSYRHSLCFPRVEKKRIEKKEG
jgi:hypothetical protein